MPPYEKDLFDKPAGMLRSVALATVIGTSLSAPLADVRRLSAASNVTPLFVQVPVFKLTVNLRAPPWTPQPFFRRSRTTLGVCKCGRSAY